MVVGEAQALSVLASTTAMKREGAREGVSRILTAAALTYDQLEQISSQLLVLLNEHEHSPPLIAEVAQSSARLGDTRLVCSLFPFPSQGVFSCVWERERERGEEQQILREREGFVCVSAYKGIRACFRCNVCDHSTVSLTSLFLTFAARAETMSLAHWH